MSLIQFLNNTCNIVNETVSIVWWEETISDVAVYTWIKCHYYKFNQWNLNKTDESLETDESYYKVMIEPNKTNVASWMKLTLIDSDLWTIGKYLIEEVKINRLIDGSNDSIELIIKAIW